ncbi:hypothetical protein [Oceanobacillus damuensis]|uniref:hypothetical protein n=1 Tax=Oceanobacillus damuensis TaxID=937928 RepID=UPI000831A846|nr:hypothetical protein [Oceanobacillus damuensis]
MIEGIPDNIGRPANLNADKTMQFTVSAPISEVFTSTDLLDIENPSIELKGYVKEKNREIPFGMSGGLRVYDESFQQVKK